MSRYADLRFFSRLEVRRDRRVLSPAVELNHREVHRSSETLDVLGAGLVLPALDAADLAVTHARAVGELDLRQPLKLAPVPNALTWVQ